VTLRAVIRMGGFAGLAAMALAQPAVAQPMGGPPNALQGFSINREKPIRITSTTLEVRDKEKRATFIGNVVVAQGDTTMKSKTLDVFYDQDNNGEDAKQAQPGSPDTGQIRRLEAKGGVVVTQKDQTATGETGIFDTPTNTVTLIGNVVITQGPQVIKGDRLTVDLTSGESHVDGSKSGVQALFFPNQRPKSDKSADSKAAENAEVKDARSESRNSESRNAAKPSGKSTPNHPLRLN
jgi:lipopolysaccharide export system protein LptA